MTCEKCYYECNCTTCTNQECECYVNLIKPHERTWFDRRTDYNHPIQRDGRTFPCIVNADNRNLETRYKYFHRLRDKIEQQLRRYYELEKFIDALVDHPCVDNVTFQSSMSEYNIRVYLKGIPGGDGWIDFCMSKFTETGEYEIHWGNFNNVANMSETEKATCFAFAETYPKFDPNYSHWVHKDKRK